MGTCKKLLQGIMHSGMVYRFLTTYSSYFLAASFLIQSLTEPHTFTRRSNIITSILHNTTCINVLHRLKEAMNVERADLPLERDHKTTQPAIIIIYHHFSFD